VVGRYAVVLFLILAAIFSIAYFFAAGTPGPLGVVLLFNAGFVLGGIVGLLAHEAGHLLCAMSMSIPVRLLSIGTGAPLFRLRVGETSLELRQNLWRGGFVSAYPALIRHKYRMMFFLIGGVMGEAALLALMMWSSAALSMPVNVGLVLSGAALAQILQIIGSLMPRDVKIDGKTLGTDGRQLWQTLRGPRSGPTALGLWVADYLNKYRVGTKPTVPSSHAAARICHHWLSGRWADEKVRRDADAAFMRELERGALAPEVELLVLESLLTDALVFADPDLRVHLDAWSSRALSLAPAIKTVRGTRGGVLVELGQYAEAKPFLEPLTSAEETSLDRVLAHAFLARAEYALGNAEQAVRHISQARKICDADSQFPAVGCLVRRIEAEVSVVAPASDNQLPKPKEARPE